MNYENPDSANFISRQEFNIVCNQLAQALEIITTLITNSGQLSADDYKMLPLWHL